MLLATGFSPVHLKHNTAGSHNSTDACWPASTMRNHVSRDAHFVIRITDLHLSLTSAVPPELCFADCSVMFDVTAVSEGQFTGNPGGHRRWKS